MNKIKIFRLVPVFIWLLALVAIYLDGVNMIREMLSLPFLFFTVITVLFFLNTNKNLLPFIVIILLVLPTMLEFVRDEGGLLWAGMTIVLGPFYGLYAIFKGFKVMKINLPIGLLNVLAGFVLIGTVAFYIHLLSSITGM